MVFSGFAAHFLSLWGSASLSFAPTSADRGGLEGFNLRGRCFNGGDNPVARLGCWAASRSAEPCTCFPIGRRLSASRYTAASVCWAFVFS